MRKKTSVAQALNSYQIVHDVMRNNHNPPNDISFVHIPLLGIEEILRIDVL